jgi:hypothetical protein
LSRFPNISAGSGRAILPFLCCRSVKEEEKRGKHAAKNGAVCRNAYGKGCRKAYGNKNKKKEGIEKKQRGIEKIKDRP